LRWNAAEVRTGPTHLPRSPPGRYRRRAARREWRRHGLPDRPTMTSSLQFRSAMRQILDEQHRRLLKQGLQPMDENCCIVAVDHTMIEARREIHHLARNELSAIPHGSNSHLVDADDGDLRMIDDRCRRDRAQRTERGDYDGGASQLAAIGSGFSRIL